MVERQLPKLHTRVRFPSPAPIQVMPARQGFLAFSDTNFLTFCEIPYNVRTNRPKSDLRNPLAGSPTALSKASRGNGYRRLTFIKRYRYPSDRISDRSGNARSGRHKRDTSGVGVLPGPHGSSFAFLSLHDRSCRRAGRCTVAIIAVGIITTMKVMMPAFTQRRASAGPPSGDVRRPIDR
jgi:hypothetical protein